MQLALQDGVLERAELCVAQRQPILEIGDQPLLMHIMRNFAAQGFNEFVICLGYKGYIIKEYFANLRFHLNDLHFESLDSDALPLKNFELNWKVDLITIKTTLYRVMNYDQTRSVMDITS